MRYLKLFLIPLLILCPLSYAGTIDPNTPDSKYVEYAKDFHCVVKICGVCNDNSLFCASAVLIDDHHILTAAHVVNESKLSYISIKDKKYIISEIIIHKDFEKEFGSGDIALCYSKESFGLDFYPKLYEEDDETNKVCSIAGYGLYGTFLTGAKESDDNRRAGSNTIDRLFSDVLVCSPSKRNEEDYTQLEFCIASGDSGGGLFIDGKLAGINSFIMASNRSPNGRYDEEACHTRVSKFVRWINDNKKKMD